MNGSSKASRTIPALLCAATLIGLGTDRESIAFMDHVFYSAQIAYERIQCLTHMNNSIKRLGF